MDKPIFMGKIRNVGVLSAEGGAGDTMSAQGQLVNRPNFTSGPTRTSISGSSVTYTATPDTGGTIYAVALPEDATRPEPQDVVDGTGNSNDEEAVAISKTSAAATAGQAATLTLNNITQPRVLVYFVIRTTAGVLSAFAVSRLLEINAGLPVNWNSQDIGVATNGSAKADSAGLFTVTGNGGAMQGNVDSLHFAYLPLTGNGRLEATVVSLSPDAVNPRGGIMIRGSTEPGSPYMALFFRTGDFAVRAFWRSATGTAVQFTSVVLSSLPRVCRFTRDGNNLTAAIELDDGSEQVIRTQAITLSETCLAGLFSAADNGTLAVCEFAEVTLQTFAPPAQAPVFVGGVQATNETTDGFEIPYQLDQAGNGYAVVTTTEALQAPNSPQVKAGFNAQNNDAIAKAGPIATPPLTQRKAVFTGLEPGRVYAWHIVAEGNNGLLQQTPSRGTVQTKAIIPDPPPPPPGENEPIPPNGEEVASITNHFDADCWSKGTAQPWGSAIMTGRDGRIYLMYQDSGLFVHIVCIPPTGPIIDSGRIHKTSTDGHHPAAFGIAEDGTIFFACCTHNKKLEDGFVAQETENGPAFFMSGTPWDVRTMEPVLRNRSNFWPKMQGMTYPTFFQNPHDGRLFLFCRTTSTRSGEKEGGWRQLSLDYWDSRAKEWKTCGGDDYPHKLRDGMALFWSDGGRRLVSNCTPQNNPCAAGGWPGCVRHNGLYAHAFVDRNNVIHVAFDNQSGRRCVPDQTFYMQNVLNGDPRGWRGANGRILTPLPLSFNPGLSPTTRHVDLAAPTSADGPLTYPAVDREGRPVIQYADGPDLDHGGPKKIARFNGSNWDNQIPMPEASSDGPMVGSWDGVLTRFANGSIYRNWRNGIATGWDKIDVDIGRSDRGLKPDRAWCASHNRELRIMCLSGSRIFFKTIRLKNK